MSLPTHEEYLKSAAVWRGEHNGVSYSLSHHGVSDYSPDGTWCFYIHLTEEIFLSPESFAAFDREPEVKKMGGLESYYETYDYWSVPDHGFHGGITFYERTTYVGKFDGLPKKALKIGCDYAHSWDRDGGYWEGKNDVERDAKRLIEKLVIDYPVKARCGYSGVLDEPGAFYTARNGSRVHRSQADKFSETEWPMWLPAEEAAVSDDKQVGILRKQNEPQKPNITGEK